MEDLSLWIETTRAQGDPSLYRHDELEMYIMRIFEKYHFVGGKKTSKRDKRHAFSELWDASGGNTMAIAHGFETALKNKVYTIPYVKACITGYELSKKLPPEIRRSDIFTQPKIVKNPPKIRPKLTPVEIPKADKPTAPKRSRLKKTEEPPPPVKVKWK